MPLLRPEVMLIKHSRSKKPVKIMDPDCAICSQPALAQCECEAKGLDIAVRQAEQRMMTTVFNDIRYASSSPLPFPLQLTPLTKLQSLGPRPRPRLHPLLLLYAHNPPQRPTLPKHPPHDGASGLLFPRTPTPSRNRCRGCRTEARHRRRLEGKRAALP